MDNGNQWKNMSDQIMGSVAEALSTGDFSKLNSMVGDAVNNALSEAGIQVDTGKSFSSAGNGVRDNWYRSKEETLAKEIEWKRRQLLMREEERRRHADWIRQRDANRQMQRQIRQEFQNRRSGAQGAPGAPGAPGAFGAPGGAGGAGGGSTVKNELANVKFNRVGEVSGILYTVFGSIGIGASLLLTLSLFSLFGMGQWLLGSALLLGGAGTMLRAGTVNRERLQRAKRYIQLCRDKMFADVDYLAKQTGRSARYIKRDLKKMLQLGMFPEGHLDEKGTCFMLDDALYSQYMQATADYKKREALQKEEQARKSEEIIDVEATEITEADAKNQELEAMIAEGRACMEKLEQMNADIPGEEITRQLDELGSLLQEIFDRVKEHPEQMHRMHRMMDYYLPTTVKLVEAYRDFDKVSAPGEQIQNAKAEIEKTLGIINDAFVELLNNLFQDTAFDVTADAQVLQTMLAKEGLTGTDTFAGKQKKQ